MSILHSKEKKGRLNHEIVKIGQQMLKFQEKSYVQIHILSSPIFIFSVKSIKNMQNMRKHVLCITETCTNELIFKLFLHTFLRKISLILIWVEIDRYTFLRFCNGK